MIQALKWINAESKTLSKVEIKANGMFGFELIEEVVPDVTLYQSRDKVGLGTLCRTSSGVRFVLGNEIYTSLDNEVMDEVVCHPVSVTGCLPWLHFGCKALTFTKLDSSEPLSFAVPDGIAQSWAEHFDVG